MTLESCWRATNEKVRVNAAGRVGQGERNVSAVNTHFGSVIRS